MGGGGKLLRRRRLEVNLQLWSASVKIRAAGTRVLMMPLVVVGDTAEGTADVSASAKCICISPASSSCNGFGRQLEASIFDFFRFLLS